MTRKAVMTAILLLWASVNLLAGPVTRSQALGKAKEWAGRHAKAGALSCLTCKVEKVGKLPCYAFDIGHGEGFVIVAGDDRMDTVLGYADIGSFDLKDMPPALKAWLMACGEELETLDNGTSKAYDRPAKVLEKTRGALAPLISCLWNQQEPYSNNCPDFLDEGKCATGCVATAMAQVLYYYREQNVRTIQEEISPYTCSTNWSGYGKISVPGVPKGTVVDWEHLLGEYKGTETAEEAEAVANLMFYCAAALKTEFVGPSSGYSTATNTNIPNALKKQFGFSSECCLKDRSAYAISQWEEMVYDELKAGRPVIYIGRSESVGHCFVVDGYDGDGLYHINWGWSGLYNGYYRLSSLSCVEGSTTKGYTMTQSAVFGAHPASNSNGLPALSASALALSGTTLSFTMTNFSGLADNFKFGVAAILDDGSLAVLKQSTSFIYMADRAKKATSFALSKANVASLEKGEYLVTPVFCRKSDNLWHEADCSTQYSYKLVWDGSTFSLSYNSPVSERVFSATGFQLPGNPVVGVKVPVGMTLSCSGGEYSSEVYLFASTTTTANSYASKTGVYLRDGEQCDISLYFSPGKAGTYNVWVATDTGGKNSIGSCKVKVTEAGTEGELSVTGFTVENAVASGEWNTVYGKMLKGTITLKNIGSSLYSDIITIWLMKGATKSYYLGSVSDKMLVTLGKGESMTVDYAYEEGETGNYYQLWIMKGGSIITNGKVRFFELVPGITIYDGKGNYKVVKSEKAYAVPENVVAVDMDGSGVASVTPNSNPNTLYFIGETDAIPSGLEGCNVVKAGLAEKVVLADGYDFFTPIAFHANDISYSRTPKLQTSGKGGWETIVLPFAVQEVSNATDNKVIDWFHRAADRGKNFWLKEYAMQDTETGTVYFNHVEQFRPHVPYIIAVPSDRWGVDNDLTGKELRFHATNVEVGTDAKLMVKSSVYRFEGSYVETSVGDVFVLNSQGSSFTRTDKALLKPFRACFHPKGGGNALASLAIGDFTMVDGIDNVELPASTADIYTISGVKVGSTANVAFGDLPKGVYVVNGKKYVVR